MKRLIIMVLVMCGCSMIAQPALSLCDMPNTWECIESDNVDGFVLTWFPKLMPVIFMAIIVHTKANDRGTWEEGIMFYGFPYAIIIQPDLTTYEE